MAKYRNLFVLLILQDVFRTLLGSGSTTDCFCSLIHSTNIEEIHSTWSCSSLESLCHKWNGVHCNSATEVVSLQLKSSKIEGSLPSCIGSLTSLEILDLSGNSFQGSIPSSIGFMSALNTLSLSRNSFSGEIPSSVSLLTKLTFLSLYENSIIGTLPEGLGNLYLNLKSLYLNGTNLSGTIPLHIGLLTNLVELVINTNKFTGKIPSTIIKLTNLQRLEAYENSLTGNIHSDIGMLSNLKILRLYSNKLSGLIPSSIGSMHQLFSLKLFSNKFVGTIPYQLNQCTELQYLFLDHNSLSGTIPPSFSKLQQLISLRLSSNHFVGTISPSFNHLSKLQILQLSQNQFTGSISNSPFTDGFNLLTDLEIHDNYFSGSIPESLCERNLNYLDAHNAPRLTCYASCLTSIKLHNFGDLTSCAPTSYPTVSPTPAPSRSPSFQPSRAPSVIPTHKPSHEPTVHPTPRPTEQPTHHPSGHPSAAPTSHPTRVPIGHPSGLPTAVPTGRPSFPPVPRPSAPPSSYPSGEPTATPSSTPTGIPSRYPTGRPSSEPSATPSDLPSETPLASPSGVPSIFPSFYPTKTAEEVITCLTFTIGDRFGDGWEGNTRLLVRDDHHQMFYEPSCEENPLDAPIICFDSLINKNGDHVTVSLHSEASFPWEVFWQVNNNGITYTGGVNTTMRFKYYFRPPRDAHIFLDYVENLVSHDVTCKQNCTVGSSHHIQTSQSQPTSFSQEVKDSSSGSIVGYSSISTGNQQSSSGDSLHSNSSSSPSSSYTAVNMSVSSVTESTEPKSTTATTTTTSSPSTGTSFRRYHQSYQETYQQRQQKQQQQQHPQGSDSSTSPPSQTPSSTPSVTDSTHQSARIGHEQQHTHVDATPWITEKHYTQYQTGFRQFMQGHNPSKTPSTRPSSPPRSPYPTRTQQQQQDWKASGNQQSSRQGTQYPRQQRQWASGTTSQQKWQQYAVTASSQPSTSPTVRFARQYSSSATAPYRQNPSGYDSQVQASYGSRMNGGDTVAQNQMQEVSDSSSQQQTNAKYTSHSPVPTSSPYQLPGSSVVSSQTRIQEDEGSNEQNLSQNENQDTTQNDDGVVRVDSEVSASETGETIGEDGASTSFSSPLDADEQIEDAAEDPYSVQENADYSEENETVDQDNVLYGTQDESVVADGGSGGGDGVEGQLGQEQDEEFYGAVIYYGPPDTNEASTQNEDISDENLVGDAGEKDEQGSFDEQTTSSMTVNLSEDEGSVELESGQEQELDEYGVEYVNEESNDAAGAAAAGQSDSVTIGGNKGEQQGGEDDGDAVLEENSSDLQDYQEYEYEDMEDESRLRHSHRARSLAYKTAQHKYGSLAGASECSCLPIWFGSASPSTDSVSNPWDREHKSNGAQYFISDVSGNNLVHSGSPCFPDTDTISTSLSAQCQVCLDSGDYKLRITGALDKGSSGHIAWEYCGVHGGAEAELTFTIDGSCKCIPSSLTTASDLCSSTASSEIDFTDHEHSRFNVHGVLQLHGLSSSDFSTDEIFVLGRAIAQEMNEAVSMNIGTIHSDQITFLSTSLVDLNLMDGRELESTEKIKRIVEIKFAILLSKNIVKKHIWSIQHAENLLVSIKSHCSRSMTRSNLFVRKLHMRSTKNGLRHLQETSHAELVNLELSIHDELIANNQISMAIIVLFVIVAFGIVMIGFVSLSRSMHDRFSYSKYNACETEASEHHIVIKSSYLGP